MSDEAGWQLMAWAVMALWFLTMAAHHYEWRQIVKICEKSQELLEKFLAEQQEGGHERH